MAVESKSANNGAGNVATTTATPPATAKGTGAHTALTQPGRRKRSSSLMQSATSLPTVEHSLEEFIAKANQTLVDVSSWEAVSERTQKEEEQRREQDAQRWKAAETQMRESAAREQSLRRQLDGLQGKLAEAEARAAVAGTQVGSAAHDSTISELKTQIDKAMHRMRSAEERSQELAHELARQKADASARPASELPIGGSGPVDADAAERIRLAELKAAKALAAARAAQAGLTINPADLEALESGLAVAPMPSKKTPWVPILAAFAGGIAIMFGVWKFALSTPDTKPSAAAATPAVTEPAAPASGGASKPSVTPIDDGATPQPAGAEEAKEAKAVAKDEPKADEPKDEAMVEPKDEAKVEAKAETKTETKSDTETDEPAQDEVKEAPKPAPKAVAKKATKPATKKAAKKPAKTESLADPFADAPAPKKPAKPAGGIVDPF